MAVVITEILADNNTEAQSSVVTVDAGYVVTLILRGANSHSGLEIQIQSSTGWVYFGSLSAKNPAAQVQGPGNYRLVRNAGTQAAADKAV